MPPDRTPSQGCGSVRWRSSSDGLLVEAWQRSRAGPAAPARRRATPVRKREPFLCGRTPPRLAWGTDHPAPRRRNSLSRTSRSKLGNGDLGRPYRPQQGLGNNDADEGEGGHNESDAAVTCKPILRGYHEPSKPSITHDRQRTDRRPVSSKSGLGPRRREAACPAVLRANMSPP
jgi:hypothetical protein